jgi:hypothetical protein
MKVGFIFLTLLEDPMVFHQVNSERWIGMICCSITTVSKQEGSESETP